MMKKSRFSAALITSFSLLMAISAASPDCWAFITFVGDCQDPGCLPPNNPSTDFNLATNWDPTNVFPNTTEAFLIQNNRTATFSSGSTTLGGLIVANDSFGRLRMTGGSLTTVNSIEAFEIGRERFPKPKQGDYNNNGIVDAADYTLWRDTLDQAVLNPGDGADGDQSEVIDQGDFDFWNDRFGLVTKGGEVIMTGSSSLTANGVIVGRRSKGLLTVGPQAVVDVQGANFVGGAVRSKDMEVGSFGPAFIAITNEPGLEADGLAIVEGTVNANALIINAAGSKGELRVLPGGRVNLNGALVLSQCNTQFFPSGCGLVANPEPLMSSKLTIIGSGGTISVGEFDPVLSPPPGFEPEIRRDFFSDFPADATISFTADAGGVTPIVIADNSAFPGEFSGTARLAGTVGRIPGTFAQMNLELNLDAFPFTPTSTLTLIDAPAGIVGDPASFHLVGEFAVTFLGTTIADVNYDNLNGNVFLDNFRIGPAAGTGSLAAAGAVPEPSGLAMIVALGLLLCSHSVRARNGNRPGRHKSRGQSLT